MWIKICVPVRRNITPSPHEIKTENLDKIDAKILKYNHKSDDQEVARVSNFMNNVVPVDDRTLNFKLTIGKIVSVGNSKKCRLYIKVSGAFLETLRVIKFASRQALLPLFVYVYGKPISEEPEITKTIQLSQNVQHGSFYYDGFAELVVDQVEYQTTVTIAASVKHLLEIENTLPELFLRNWNILKMEPGDFTLVTENGKPFSCHKLFMKESPVFDAMFNPTSDFVEKANNEVRLQEISQEAVAAFLEYIYCRVVIRASVSARVCLEVFQAAHKYLLPKLEDEMRKLLLELTTDAFDLDTVLNMYKFVRQYEHKDKQQLKEKVIQILRSTAELEKSKIFKKIFIDEPVVATEIALLALGFKGCSHE